MDHMIWMDEQGWPLSWRKISIIARDIAKREQISCDACRQWRKYFKRRHPELTTRVAENLENKGGCYEQGTDSKVLCTS